MQNTEGGAPLSLGVLWGKSNAGGSSHLLVAHLLDTAAVAESMWDGYLAPSIRSRLDRSTAGHGREFLSLVCGLHDVGKATPAFQSKDADLASRVRAAGLSFGSGTVAQFRDWPHTLAGAYIVRRELAEHGWDRVALGWVEPLIAGHHGRIEAAGQWKDVAGRQTVASGGEPWARAQHELVARLMAELGLDLSSMAPTHAPSRAIQLALSGAIVMADWIASGDHFVGQPELGMVSMAVARCRARQAWEALNLREGWSADQLSGSRLMQQRFERAARPIQDLSAELATSSAAPALILIEAPMGEGKTEAALVASEILAKKFGADGLFVGMPTQATSDPMFARVRHWLGTFAPETQTALLHGKRRFNREWRSLVVASDPADIYDADDADDPYGARFAVEKSADLRDPAAPAEWFLGAKRGLLVPVTVGTIDQLLYAATRTRHVMLRHLGLAGRIVVLDEVHAYDVYMSQFLQEALRWLADAGVCVVLLSATLPSETRESLVRAFAQGATQQRDVPVPVLEPTGYPSVSRVVAGPDGGVEIATRSTSAWRPSLRVAVDVLDEDETGNAVVDRVLSAAQAGGCILVVRNTVARAQGTYRALQTRLGADVELLHGRLTVAERAARTERILDRLGADGERPARYVVVATQVAEQSFDVDADLVVTDLAPMDLLLQRIGRLHRHSRAPEARPAQLREPRVVVTGLQRLDSDPPALPAGSRAVYGAYPLLRAAAILLSQEADGWSIPADVPRLVASAYREPAERMPPAWLGATALAKQEALAAAADRAARAREFLLASPDDLGKPNLAGLHTRSVAQSSDEDAAMAVVRDGDPSVEVVLVRYDHDRGTYLSLSGRRLGASGEAIDDADVLDEVVGDAIRLPAIAAVTTAALTSLRPLPGWGADPWLRRVRALVLDEVFSAELGGYRFVYDAELGLLHERSPGRRRPLATASAT